MRGLLRVAFWFAAIFAFVMAVLPQPPAIDVSDKLQHMAAFFVITVLGGCAYPQVSRLRLAGALCAFGGLIEIVQMLPALGRDSELDDWLADIAAVAIAFASMSFAQRIGALPSD